MSRITVICTRHEEHGNCNSSQLLSIVEKSKPSVIFEELSLSNFNRSYLQNDLITLETNTIKRYCVNKEIKQLPVDTYPRTREHDESVDQLYSRLTGGITLDAFNYRQIMDRQQELISFYGFSFLNSSENDQVLNELDSLKAKILEQLKEERLYEIYQAEVKMIKDRENEMLKNIYAFATSTPFDEAVMFIGSGHRRSIFPLIEKYERQEETKLTWRNYLTL